MHRCSSAPNPPRHLHLHALPLHDLPTPQPSEEFVEGLRAKPWWEPQEFQWVSELEERSSIVIDEFKAFWNDPMSGFAKDSVNMNIMGKGWSGVRLQRLGEWIPENCEKFPQTVELLKELQIPLAVRGVMFARQVPGSGVSPHTDGRNFILTTHLGERAAYVRRRTAWCRSETALQADARYKECLCASSKTHPGGRSARVAQEVLTPVLTFSLEMDRLLTLLALYIFLAATNSARAGVV